MPTVWRTPRRPNVTFDPRGPTETEGRSAQVDRHPRRDADATPGRVCQPAIRASARVWRWRWSSDHPQRGVGAPAGTPCTTGARQPCERRVPPRLSRAVRAATELPTIISQSAAERRARSASTASGPPGNAASLDRSGLPRQDPLTGPLLPPTTLEPDPPSGASETGAAWRGRAAEPAEGLVETRDHRRQRPVPDRDDRPVPAPGERPGDAPVPRRVRALDVGHRPPRGPLGAVEAEREQLLVGDVGARTGPGSAPPTPRA